MRVEGKTMRAFFRQVGNRKEIRLKRTQKEMRMNSDAVGWYENPKESGGVIFGRIVMSGDRCDAWANHVYHIALKKSGRGFKILGFLHCSYGWYGKTGESPKEWKPRMIKLAASNKKRISNAIPI